MSNPFDMIIQELKDRNTADYNKFPPFFISSVGCHYFNLINQQQHLYQRSGVVENTRLNIIMVAPQGQSKSFWLKQFLDKDNSIVKGTAIKTDFELRMTEAGYMGTKKFGEHNQIIESEGLCQEEINSIVGIEEFSDLMKSIDKQDYNIGLDNELLTTLDSGDGVKRMAAGTIRFKTNLTMWAATQPGRYNLTSGLGRRFLFIFNIPTEDSIKDLRERRRAAIDVQTNAENLFEIKKALNQRFDEITVARSVKFDPSFYDYLNRFNLMAHDEILFEKLALGYTLMKAEKLEPDIVVDMDGKLRQMIKQEWTWRSQIKRGTEDSMVWTYIESAGDISKQRCIDVLLDFGMELPAAEKAIRNLVKKKLIEVKNGKIILRDQNKFVSPEDLVEQSKLEEKK
jgi:hypothetical protein